MLNIRELRKKKKLSQKELADKIGVSLRTIQYWESGKKNITLDKANLVAHNLEIDVQDLLSINDKHNIGSKKEYNEVEPVPEGDYIVVEFEDLETAAGIIGKGDVSLLPEKKKRLVPKEYSTGNYLVIRVHGHSMDDNTKRSISEGEEILIKEYYDNLVNLPIRNKLFVITTNSGSVVKQIKKIDTENRVILCHSFNPQYEDYEISFDEILQFFTVEKKVKSNIIF